ncbi:hypothetical protein, partial [Gordonia paraffinivorans]|uniref:hypothetical protein n=1 Tax=Gordonia paraffinivorans TaxID=175628 RepID=UPI00242CDFBC
MNTSSAFGLLGAPAQSAYSAPNGKYTPIGCDHPNLSTPPWPLAVLSVDDQHLGVMPHTGSSKLGGQCLVRGLACR